MPGARAGPLGAGSALETAGQSCSSQLLPRVGVRVPCAHPEPGSLRPAGCWGSTHSPCSARHRRSCGPAAATSACSDTRCTGCEGSGPVWPPSHTRRPAGTGLGSAWAPCPCGGAGVQGAPRTRALNRRRRRRGHAFLPTRSHASCSRTCTRLRAWRTENGESALSPACTAQARAGSVPRARVLGNPCGLTRPHRNPGGALG